MDAPWTILVADDQAASRDGVARILREAGCRVVTAVDGQDCLDKVAHERPDLAILDVVMPRVGGIDVCRAIRKDHGEFFPILLLSGRADTPTRVDGLRAGAQDFMAKPWDPDELRARVENLLQIRQLVLGRGLDRPPTVDEETKDALTGLGNQRYLTQRLAEEFQRAERNTEPLSLLAIDLDSFDELNGRYGRGAGDRLLVACARTVARSCRQTDVITRPGGDEFVVVLPGMHFTGCVTLAERIWREIRATVVQERDFKLACEACIGVASYPSRDVTTPKDLLRFAHAALARAKAEGRGRICLYQFQGYLFQPA
jgi:diguanylate cyclase (GGDEF)-like protein